MNLRISLVETTVERVREALPDVKIWAGNWAGECASRPIDIDVNLWYVLDEETPGVVYYRSKARA